MIARDHALKDMGISVVTGGLAVDSGKRYLVNLNADPSLNELLVYYLRDTVTRVGSGPAVSSPEDAESTAKDGSRKFHCLESQ